MAEEPDKFAAELTRRMAGGERAAIEAFYVRYFDFLLAQARRATHRDEAFCLDVVQDAVLRVMRTIRGVESEAQLAGWLRLVVRAAAYDALKSERRRKWREMAVVSAGPPEAAADDGERIEMLRAEIARLDPQLARMIELRFEKRLTLAGIGQLLGLSVGTVDGRLRRLLGKLRIKLTERDGE